MDITESLKAVMAESEINNSFDLQSTSDTLKLTLENSFAYLYRLQRNVVKFKEFYFPTSKTSTTSEVPYGDMYLDDSLRVCIKIDADLVRQTSREKFYNSTLYKQEFTMEDIYNNQDIFERLPLVSVDREYLFNIKIRMDNGHTTIILPYLMAFLLTKNNAIVEHETSIILIDNIYYDTIQTHKGSLDLMMENNLYCLGPTYVGLDSFRTDGTYMVSLSFNNETVSSLLSPCTVLDDGMLQMNLYPRELELITTYPDPIYITIIFFPDMYEHTMKSGNPIVALKHPKTSVLETPLCVIEREDCVTYNMPIPTENIMVLKRIVDGSDYSGSYSPFTNATTKLYYPNIYSITDDEMEESDIYRIFYFYKKGYDLHYTNKYAYYYRYVKREMSQSSLEEAINKAHQENITHMDVTGRDAFVGILHKVMNYPWYDYRYDTIDFVKKYSSSITPYEYKENRFKEFVKADTEALRKYVFRQNDINDSYYAFVENINLSERLRTDTSEELSYTYTFDEPRYLFLFQNNTGDSLLNVRIWIDGLLCMDKYHVNEFGIDYIYIPTTLISEDSYLEMEVMHYARYEGSVYFQDTEEYNTVNIIHTGDMTPTMSDLIFINQSNDMVADTENFEIQRTRSNLDFSTLNSAGSLKTKFAIMDTIKIRALNDDVLHTYFTLAVRKNPYYIQEEPDRSGYPLFTVKPYHFNPNMEYIRIWYNGRLMFPNMYTWRNTDVENRIQTLFKITPGDNFAFEITPYRNEIIYTSLTIPQDGIIDLSGYIDKPIDIRYYDIFVNGRKLNEYHAYPVSDTTLRLVHLKSLKNLIIYQKSRDEEYYGWTKNNITYYFKVEDLLEESFIDAETRWEIIEDITLHVEDENVDEEKVSVREDVELDEALRVKIFYYEELLPNRLMLPETMQFNKAVLYRDYIEVANTYLIEDSEIANTANANNAIGYQDLTTDVLYLDPDVNYDTAGEVYFLGDYDSVCEAIIESGKGASTNG